MSQATPQAINDLTAALSAPRVATYLHATAGDGSAAMELYAWNARIASALMVPAHVAEVATRNAVDDALTALYGPQWPWSQGFTASLPAPDRGYNPRRDLLATRSRFPTTGKVIAELKFVFWQRMFTARHDRRLWTSHIQRVFPNSPAATPAQLRQRVYDDLEAVRLLRNRIAHHEPIFTRPLAVDLARMLDLVHLRCDVTAAWTRGLEDATAILAARP